MTGIARGARNLRGVPRFAVLLRGINVGRNKRVAMADLRALLAEAGYTDVRTHLNSGNAVVTGADAPPDAHATRIEAAITTGLGLDVRCVVLTAAHLAAVVEAHPFAEVADDGSRMMVHVLAVEPEPQTLADLLALDPERTRPGDRVIYQWCPDGLMKAPPVWTAAEKRLGVVTTRNWNTITKLYALL